MQDAPRKGPDLLRSIHIYFLKPSKKKKKSGQILARRILKFST